MRILVVEPDKNPYVKEITGSLESMQDIVGGLIEAVYPFKDNVALICNDEGKILNLPWNRFIVYDMRNYDVIAGTFFICSCPPDGESFESLSDEQIEKYSSIFEL